jgi:large subunit ribosomal protein L15
MNLHKLPAVTRRKKRRGRGIGSRGAKSGRGMKGQRSRAGFKNKAGFEGGQTPIYLRLPKGKGTKQAIRWPRSGLMTLNTDKLVEFPAGSLVNIGLLKEKRIIRRGDRGVKLVQGGEFKVKLTVRVQAATEGAKKVIEAAGGKVEIVN